MLLRRLYADVVYSDWLISLGPILAPTSEWTHV